MNYLNVQDFLDVRDYFSAVSYLPLPATYVADFLEIRDYLSLVSRPAPPGPSLRSGLPQRYCPGLPYAVPYLSVQVCLAARDSPTR